MSVMCECVDCGGKQHGACENGITDAWVSAHKSEHMSTILTVVTIVILGCAFLPFPPITG